MDNVRRRSVQRHIVLLMLLLIATIGCLSLSEYLRGYTQREIYLFLNWDMFLAWVPIGLALFMNILDIYVKKNRIWRRILFVLIGVVWLLFYPNSAYLVTDMLHPFVHFRPESGERFTHHIEFWYHLIVFFSAAIIGLLLSIYSLLVVQGLVKRAFGRIMGWMFVVMIVLLSSFGIYIGRFVRWNSWDMLLKPHVIIRDTFLMLTDQEQLALLLPFTGLIFTVTLLSYCIVYGLSYIRQ